MVQSLVKITDQVRKIITPLITPEIKELNLKLPKSGSKYFVDWEDYLKKAYNRYIALGLRNICELTILDVGTGIGFFPYICLDNFNDVYCTEDKKDSDSLVLAAYKKIHNDLGLRCNYFHINSRYFPVKGSFDIITSFNICWNVNDDGTYWRFNDYELFFSNLISHLKPEGKIFLGFLKPSIKLNIFSILKSNSEFDNRIKLLKN